MDLPEGAAAHVMRLCPGLWLYTTSTLVAKRAALRERLGLSEDEARRMLVVRGARARARRRGAGGGSRHAAAAVATA
jgi:hypothetical protein